MPALRSNTHVCRQKSRRDIDRKPQGGTHSNIASIQGTYQVHSDTVTMMHTLLLLFGARSSHGHLACAMQLVGSVLAEDAKALPAELDAFLNQALAANGGQGAILASLGTLALLTEHEVRSIAQGLCALDRHVLWKLDTQQLPGTPSSGFCMGYASPVISPPQLAQ